MNTAISAALAAQQGHLFPWAAVCFGLGIALFFALPVEPGWLDYTLCAAAGGAGVIGARAVRAPVVGWAIGLIVLGGLVAGARSHLVAGPVLQHRYYGPVEGRVISQDRSHSDRTRLMLDQVHLPGMDPAQTPLRVRVSLHSRIPGSQPAPGQRVMLTAHLSPPQGPVEPYAFDFRRHAWFMRLGAVGYTRSPVMLVTPEVSEDLSVRIYQLRMAIAGAVRGHIGGEEGHFAAGILTGDRSGLSQQTLEQLRAANLAHLLAISGLHMGLVVGVVFGAVRLLIACIPWLALRLSGKKTAAICAGLAAVGYLLLSGASVATQRALVMAAVLLIAVCLERRALSLRAVAVAAFVVLLWRPEALLGPGFQMSFAATTALVAVFGQLRDQTGGRRPAWLAFVISTVISSAVAGGATAPFAAAHFNQLAPYGLLANLLAVPIMALWVMPVGVLAALLSLVGLGTVGLDLMTPGLRSILGIAEWVAAMDGAVRPVPMPPPWVLPCVAFGGLALTLLQGRARLLGGLPILAAVASWHPVERPQVLITENAGLVGVMTDAGRSLSRAKGQGFAAERWLQHDGERVSQAQAHERGPLTSGVWSYAVSGQRVVHLGRKQPLPQGLDCAGTIVVSQRPMSADPKCHVFDPARLRQTGSVALWWRQDRWQMITSRGVEGERMWTSVGQRGGQGKKHGRKPPKTASRSARPTAG